MGAVFRFLVILLGALLAGWLLWCLIYWAYSTIVLRIFSYNEKSRFRSGCNMCPVRFFCDGDDETRTIPYWFLEEHPEAKFKYKVKLIQNNLDNYYVIQVSYKGFKRIIADKKYTTIEECNKLISTLVNQHIVYMQSQISSNEENMKMRLDAERLNKKLETLND